MNSLTDTTLVFTNYNWVISNVGIWCASPLPGRCPLVDMPGRVQKCSDVSFAPPGHVDHENACANEKNGKTFKIE